MWGGRLGQTRGFSVSKAWNCLLAAGASPRHACLEVEGEQLPREERGCCRKHSRWVSVWENGVSKRL